MHLVSNLLNQNIYNINNIYIYTFSNQMFIQLILINIIVLNNIAELIYT